METNSTLLQCYKTTFNINIGRYILSKIEEKVEELVTKPINELGYRVYDVMYVKEGKDNYLRIFIDNDTGISLDDCEKVNNAITDMLDEADYIKVYDWNGKHLEDLVLPFAVSRIIATENLLYCIKQDVDKVVIYTFGLDNIA